MDAIDLSPENFKKKLADGAQPIDVRTPQEFIRGHIKKAWLIDFYEHSFSQRIRALNKKKEYAVYCLHGNRSGHAVAMMQQIGLKTFHLKGGIEAWEREGFEIEP